MVLNGRPTCFILALCITLFRASAQAEDPQIAVVEAAIDEYNQKANFHCSFEFKEGSASSFSNGLQGKYTKTNFIAKGMLTHWDNKTRFNIDFGAPSEQLGDNQSTNNSFDEMSDAKLSIRYNLKYGNTSDDVFVGFLTSGVSAKIPTESRCPNPLSFFGGGIRNVITHPCKECKDSGVFTRAIIRQDKNILELETVLEKDEGVTRQRNFIDLSFDPVLVRSVTRSSGKSGIDTYFSEYQISDFVKVGTVHVPKMIRAVIGSDKNGICMAREWRATEMRQPRAADFIMQIPAGRRILGLKANIDTSQPSSLDLNKLTPEVLADPAATLALLQQRPGAVSGGTIVLWVVAGIALIGSLTLFYWWSRR